jgi:hypothetical protein
MKNTTIKLIKVLTLVSAVSVSADVVPVGQNNIVDLSPIVVVTQPLPTLKVGQDANKNNAAIAGAVNNGVSVNLPCIAAAIPLGTVKVGGSLIGAKVGNENGVNVGPLSVSQKLPTAKIGTKANDAGLLGLRLNNGIGITLPFLSLDIPFPSLKLDHDKPATPANTKGGKK